MSNSDPTGSGSVRPTPAAGPLAVGVLLTIGLVALHVHFYRHAGPLWRDEAATVNLASMPSYAEIIVHRHYDSMPGAWTFLVHSWLALDLGSSDVALRRLGFLIGVTAIAGLWWSGRRLGLDAPLVSLVLFGMSPARIIYGDTVRGYGLAIIAAVWCMGALWAFLERQTWRTYVVAQLAALLAVQTHYGNTISLAALSAGAAAVCLRRRAWRTLALTMAIGGTAAVALLINVRGMLSSYGYSMAPTEQVQWGLGSYLESLWRALALGVPMLSAAWVIAALLAVTGCIVALRSRRDRASAAVVTYVAVAVPIALLAYVGSGWRVSKLPTQAWHYLPLVALIGLGLDVGVYALARQVAGGRTVRAAAAGVVALLVARDVMAAVSVRMTNIDLSARMIGETARPQDIVVVYPWFCGETFQRYYRGAAPWITIPDVPDHLYHPLALVAEKIKLGDAGFAPELARVEHVLRDGGRVWVVGGLLAPPLGEPAPHLPPAPDGPWGWQSAPYLTGWLTQLGALLQTHARTIRKIDLPPTGPVNEFEDAPLLVAEGWY